MRTSGGYSRQGRATHPPAVRYPSFLWHARLHILTIMTIAIAWTRRIRDCEELVFASDSRLSGDGRIFDAAPKALTLSRNDCAIVFAGLTQDAFPMMLQFSLAVSSYGPARRRSIDLSELRTHALKYSTKWLR